MRWLDSITISVDVNFGKQREMVRDREAWCAVVHGVAKNRTCFSNSTTTTNKQSFQQSSSYFDIF